MNYIDTHYVDHPGTDPRVLTLCSGSIATLPQDLDLQFLAISSAPHDYTPAQNPFIAELETLGISVAALEENYRLRDFRPSLPCWASQRLTQSNARFGHLLVWEPDVGDLDNTLRAIPEAFVALHRVAGHLGAGTAMFLAWPADGNATAEDVFRMQFFAAAALAARAQWSTLYLMVPDSLAAEAATWFSSLKAAYDDPPVQIPGHLSARARAELPLHLSAVPSRHHDVPHVTERQAAAIHAYTAAVYMPINRALRQGDMRHPDFIVMQPIIEAIASGLAQLAPHDFVEPVRRKVTPFEGIEELYADGIVTRELAFTSSTTRNPPYDGGWIFSLRGILGRYIAKLSIIPEETEVLFDSGMDQLVTSVEPSGDYHVYLDSHQVIPGAAGVGETHL